MFRFLLEVIGSEIIAIGSGAGDRPSQGRLKVWIQIAGIQERQQTLDLVCRPGAKLTETIEGLLPFALLSGKSGRGGRASGLRLLFCGCSPHDATVTF
jgi:hypothetical protein